MVVEPCGNYEADALECFGGNSNGDLATPSEVLGDGHFQPAFQ